MTEPFPFLPDPMREPDVDADEVDFDTASVDLNVTLAQDAMARFVARRNLQLHAPAHPQQAPSRALVNPDVYAEAREELLAAPLALRKAYEAAETAFRAEEAKWLIRHRGYVLDQLARKTWPLEEAAPFLLGWRDQTGQLEWAREHADLSRSAEELHRLAAAIKLALQNGQLEEPLRPRRLVEWAWSHNFLVARELREAFFKPLDVDRPAAIAEPAKSVTAALEKKLDRLQERVNRTKHVNVERLWMLVAMLHERFKPPSRKPGDWAFGVANGFSHKTYLADVKRGQELLEEHLEAASGKII